MRLGVGLGVVLLALVILDGAASGVPTRQSWAKAANAACSADYGRIRALPRPQTTALILADLRALLTIDTHLTRRLAAIPRPPSEQVAIARLLATGQTSHRVLANELIPAVARKDPLGLELISRRLDRLGARYNAIARSLGAYICAQNPAPQG